MKLMQKGLIILFSVLLTACSGLANYLDTSDPRLEGEGVTLSETIKTKDLYGAWAFATEDSDPNDVVLIFALYTDHKGLAYGLDTDPKTKVETVGADYFTWQFDEANKELNSITFQQLNGVGDNLTKKDVHKVEKHKVDLYRLDNEKLAIKLVNKEQRLIFFRMPNETYNKYIKDRPDLPRLK